MRTLLLALVLVTACQCDDSPAPDRKAEARRAPRDEELLTKLPKAEGMPFEASTLASVLPPKLGEAAAEGEALTETTPLGNEGVLPLARRVYTHDGKRITVQVTDMQHAPLMRQMVLGARAQAEKAKSPSLVPATVQGYEAVLQYMTSQHAAIANVAVTDRLFVNVRVEPAENTSAALAWAEKLALEPITKLAPPAPPPAAPAP